MSITNMSFMCIASNFTISILYTITLIFDVGLVTNILVIAMLCFPIITFTGILLGIGVIVLKESYMKSIIVIALHSAYAIGFLYIFTHF